jgi:hypothetical protein
MSPEKKRKGIMKREFARVYRDYDIRYLVVYHGGEAKIIDLASWKED